MFSYLMATPTTQVERVAIGKCCASSFTNVYPGSWEIYLSTGTFMFSWFGIASVNYCFEEPLSKFSTNNYPLTFTYTFKTKQV